MASKYTVHLDDSQIETYCLQKMPEAEASGLEEHLLTCESCRQRVAESDQYLRAMRNASSRLRAKEYAPKPRRWAASAGMLAVLAAALVVVGVGGLLRFRQPGAGTPITVTLEATRGGDAITRVPAGRRLLFRPGLDGLPEFPEYRLELVDRNGKRVWQANFTPAKGAEAPHEPSGIYFVRVYSLPGTLLREYALEIQPGQ